MGQIEPTSNPGKRATDEDRRKVIELLRQQVSAGALTLDEFSDRVGNVLETRATSDLDRLTADLPELPDAHSSRADNGIRRVVAIFGSNRRRARWTVGRRATAVALFGTSWIDLRHARLQDGEVTIKAFVFLGSVKVLVPEGIGLELSGLSVLGATTDQTRTDDVIPNGPVVRVRSRGLLGSVRLLHSAPGPFGD
jgi:hypothetical protein